MNDLYCTSELKTHCSISADNLQVMQQSRQKIFTDLSNSEMLQSKENRSKEWLTVESEKPQIDIKNLKRLRQEVQVNKKLDKVTKNISNFEQKLLKLKQSNVKLRTDQQVILHEYDATFKTFEKALSYYCQHFKIQMTTENEEDDGTLWVTVIFMSENRMSSPVKFQMDKERKNILTFDAGPLLSTKQQRILLERYNQSKNVLALFCVLRKIALTHFA